MWKSPLIMGVLNVTPDSFSDGGRYTTVCSALAQAERMVSDGADCIDIGGESTRPGATPVPVAEELRRVVPVVQAVTARFPVRLSIDTRHFEVARSAFDAGATLVNDVSGGADGRMAELVRRPGCGIVLMHMQGDPRTMQEAPSYPSGVVAEVKAYLESRVATFLEAGVPRENLWVDPGIGFGKTVAHNLALLRGLEALVGIADRLAIGTSRKGFLGALVGDPQAPISDRLAGSLASSLWAYTRGASVFRVHDVRAFRQALTTWERISDASE